MQTKTATYEKTEKTPQRTVLIHYRGFVQSSRGKAYRGLSEAQALMRVPVHQAAENVYLSLLQVGDRVRRVSSEIDQLLCHVRWPRRRVFTVCESFVGRQKHMRGSVVWIS